MRLRAGLGFAGQEAGFKIDVGAGVTLWFAEEPLATVPAAHALLCATEAWWAWCGMGSCLRAPGAIP